MVNLSLIAKKRTGVRALPNNSTHDCIMRCRGRRGSNLKVQSIKEALRIGVLGKTSLQAERCEDVAYSVVPQVRSIPEHAPPKRQLAAISEGSFVEFEWAGPTVSYRGAGRGDDDDVPGVLPLMGTPCYAIVTDICWGPSICFEVKIIEVGVCTAELIEGHHTGFGLLPSDLIGGHVFLAKNPYATHNAQGERLNGKYCRWQSDHTPRDETGKRT